MYFAILRHTRNRELPPAVLRSETVEGFKEGLIRYRKEFWESVLLLYGEELYGASFYEEDISPTSL